MSDPAASILDQRGTAPEETVRYGTEPEQLMDLRGRLGRGVPVVVIHGGFWRPAMDRAHAGLMSDSLAEAGHPVATIEYRRRPGHPDDTVADVRAAVEHVARLAPPIVIGHSAGGHLALLLSATGAPLRAALALGPVAAVAVAEGLGLGEGAVDAFLGGAAAARPDLDPVSLPDPVVPVTVIHGRADDIVPWELSELYAARHPRTRLVSLDGIGHFPVIDPRTATWATVLDELARLAR